MCLLDICSFLCDDSSAVVAFYVFDDDNSPKLHEEQLVIEVIELMLRTERYVLAIYNSDKCTGVVYFKDLIYFLVHKERAEDLLIQKFNFNLGSAITILMRLNKLQC